MVQIKYTQIFINNEWHNSVSGKTFITLNPFNEEKLADVQEGDKADIAKAVKAAVDAFQPDSEWRRLDASKRGKLLLKLVELIERDIDYLSELETADNGKPLSYALNDIRFSLECVRYAAGWADKIHGKTIPADGEVFAYTKVEPIGVCGQIIPWNFPIMMFLWKIAPALATGNTLVVKPAEQTPLTALYLASLIKEAGFPAGVVNVVPGYGPTAGGALVDHPQVDKIAFTGSTSVGKIIMETCGKAMKRLTLELGGKSPLVVTQNFDVRKAAQVANFGCFANMGQCCCAATRTFVHESIYDQFVKEAVQIAKATVYGDPMQANVTQGPQIDATQTEKIVELIESGKKQGARLLTGGQRVKGKGYFIEPTVFADVTDDMRIAQEEIFGPVQQIFKYKDFDEVIARCNATEYGLAAGLLTNDVNQIIRFTDRVKAGTIYINGYLNGSAQTPFGGYKHSGLGREMGEEGMRIYCELKTVIIAKHEQ